MVQKAYKALMVRDIEEALANADSMVIVTDHSSYLDMDLESIKEMMRTPLIVDGRNVLNADVVRSMGFRYLGIGKGK